MTFGKPRRNKRRPLAPALVATVSVVVVAVACSEPTPAEGLGDTNPKGGQGGTTGGASGRVGGSAGTRSAGAPGSGSAGAAAGGAPAQAGTAGSSDGPGCPPAIPFSGTACSGNLVCVYEQLGCDIEASCSGGQWKRSYVSDGFCNPPPACPAEPVDPTVGTCPATPGGYAWCRYQRASCASYLECRAQGSGLEWHANVRQDEPADSCCPAAAPTEGSACQDDGIVCGWGKKALPSTGPAFDVELVCRAGAWAQRNPGGSGGAGGQGGAAGGSSGGAAGDSSGGAAGGGGMVNSLDCPATVRMDDPCAQESLVCAYAAVPPCRSVATCKGGRWKVKIGSKPGAGSCNPPPACPDDEPADIETAPPPVGGFAGPTYCRYARGACFLYLQHNLSTPGWHASTVGNTCDSCCPLERPAIGEDCATPGALCPGASDEVICRDGKWAARAPIPGAGGSGGAAGSAGAGGGGPATACPDYTPLMNDPCVGDLVCGYTLGCFVTTSSCTNGRWSNASTATGAGCPAVPACPAEEPANAPTAACAQDTGSPIHGACRYPHGSCFRYLQCGAAEKARWSAPDYRSPDSCCPEKQPAKGSPCDDDGAVCSWRSVCDPDATPTPMVCLGGTWKAPTP